MLRALNKESRLQKRKFVTQMSSAEKVKVSQKLTSVPTHKWILAQHCMDRLLEKNIYAFRKEILDILNHYEIIEYKEVESRNGFNERIVVRDLNRTNVHYNLNAVFDITCHQVVSVWLNRVDDRHDSIDLSSYDSNLKIV